MGSVHVEDKSDPLNNVSVEEAHVDSGARPSCGTVIWIHVRGSLWWPAQVVDDKNVSQVSKPSKKQGGDVLVRLYGTSTYLYRNPEKYRSEFEEILKQNNGSHRDTFEKALARNLSQKTGDTSKQTVRESKDKAASETSKSRKTKHDTNKMNDQKINSPSRVSETPKPKKTKHDTNKMNDQKINSPAVVTPSTEVSSTPSVRRTRVMQTLGLVAPLGSPFHKDKAASETSKSRKTKHDTNKMNDQKINSPSRVSETPKPKKTKHDTNKMNDQKINSPAVVTPSTEVSSTPSVRRTRVMQTLGLVAPLGSPFHKGGAVVD